MKHKHHEHHSHHAHHRHHGHHHTHHAHRHGSNEAHFESMEHDNERHPMVSHQSETTPETVATNWKTGVFEMKDEAFDEAFGGASKSGVERDLHKAHSQFRDYNWA